MATGDEHRRQGKRPISGASPEGKRFKKLRKTILDLNFYRHLSRDSEDYVLGWNKYHYHFYGYSDGAAGCRGVGCGGFLYSRKTDKRIAEFRKSLLPPYDNFTAETAGILEIVRHAVGKDAFPLAIVSDCLNAVKVLRNPYKLTDNMFHVQECLYLLAGKEWGIFFGARELNFESDYLADEGKSIMEYETFLES